MSICELLANLNRAIDALPDDVRADASVAVSLLSSLFADNPTSVSKALEADS